ncbi:unnamed protein product [Rotaria sordida]|uniref:Methyltransferase domain-containing protein n=1 Tax=Rotaria sordida TaxID=392033 RepID=A0A814ZIN3_9BILA|nr:unnamed protein product [Rotaria sordida]CAF1245895.1 unnamed protein product [Rotaria sordida]CAF3565139.1 unnamed protein product [Rotaria sordida]
MSTDSNQNVYNLFQHYTNVASDYHVEPLFQSPSSSHGQWLNTIIFDVLDLKRDHILTDVGCGSGIDCLWFLNKMNNEIKIIGCDPSLGMIEIFNSEIKERNLTNIVQAFCMDAVIFSQQKELPAYNRLLLKHCVHLLSHSERLLAFKGFRQQLNSNDNKLIIVTRAPKEIFPLDKRTHEIHKSVSPSIDNYVQELEMCGFTNIKYDTYQYTFDDSVTLDDWINLIKKRLWSIFSIEKINEEQMIDLISYLKETYKHQKFQMKDEIIILHCTTMNY